jgi:hypothetical protein
MKNPTYTLPMKLILELFQMDCGVVGRDEVNYRLRQVRTKADELVAWHQRCSTAGVKKPSQPLTPKPNPNGSAPVKHGHTPAKRYMEDLPDVDKLESCA